MEYKGIDYYKQKVEDEIYKSSDRPITMSKSDYNKMADAIKNEHPITELRELLFSFNEKEVIERHKQIDAEIEYILRNKIDKPIEGEITIGKLRWRGIKNICYGENFEFLGIMQRGKLIKR